VLNIWRGQNTLGSTCEEVKRGGYMVAKAKDESLKARDLVGYDNVPIDGVEPVVSPY
jgi:hypothetical protein